MKTGPRGKYSQRGTRKLPRLDISIDVPYPVFSVIRSILQRATCDWGRAYMAIHPDGNGVLYRPRESLPEYFVGAYEKRLVAKYLREDINTALAAYREAT